MKGPVLRWTNSPGILRVDSLFYFWSPVNFLAPANWTQGRHQTFFPLKSCKNGTKRDLYNVFPLNCVNVHFNVRLLETICHFYDTFSHFWPLLLNVFYFLIEMICFNFWWFWRVISELYCLYIYNLKLLDQLDESKDNLGKW
jgi:hypothetical protein